MKTGRNFLPLFILLLFVLAIFIQMLKSQDINKEMNRVGREIDRLDKTILEDKKVLQVLRENDSRLGRLADNAGIYYLPVIIEGKELYVSLRDSDLDQISTSLALEDLLVKYHAGKGGFQSGDPKEWKKVLLKSSIKAKDHIKDVDIPAVRKRIAEVQEEINILQVERNKLFVQYQTLQQRASGTPR